MPEPTIDEWLDDAAIRCASECGLEPERVTCGTDYSCAWSINYNGSLSLADTILIARFMWRQDSGPGKHFMPGIYDATARIADSVTVKNLAGSGCYPLKVSLFVAGELALKREPNTF